MTRKGLALPAVLAIALLGGGSTGAQARTPKPKFEHKASLKSGKKNTQACVNPSPGFEPTIEGEANLAPLTASSETGEGFPVGPSNCSTYEPAAFVLGKPGQSAGVWGGSIRKGAWVSSASTAESSANETSPAYYIYESDFEASCPGGFGTVSLSGGVMADDQGGVFLNGHALGGTEGSFSGPPAAFLDETPGDFINGTNRLQVVVYDTGGLTGTDYAGKASWNCRPAL